MKPHPLKDWKLTGFRYCAAKSLEHRAYITLRLLMELATDWLISVLCKVCDGTEQKQWIQAFSDSIALDPFLPV